MSKKLKFNKLQIPKCSRENSTVSRFFSQTNQTSDCKKLRLSNSQPENTSTISKELNQNENKISEETIPMEKLNKNNKAPAEDTQNLNTLELNSNSQDESSTSKTNQLPSINLKRKTSSSSNNKNTIKKFFDESGTDGDFETPPKHPKKTTFASKLNGQQQQQNKNLKKRKRQPKINNMLLRHEMMFNKMLTEQSIAENVNPDDMQLALALSRSEYEINNHLEEDCNTNNDDENSKDSPMNIKKLKKFEYKSTRKNNDFDFNLFLPNKTRGKWATKFTPLTLRNPEKQQKKLHDNVEKFLNEEEIRRKKQHDKINNLEMNMNEKQIFINLTSDFLKSIKSNENEIISKCSLCGDVNVNDENYLKNYYVTNLISPSKVKAGYLLKDYNKIPGRDPSPDSFNIKNNENISNSVVKIETTEISLNNFELKTSSQINDGKIYDKSEKNNDERLSPDLFADCEAEIQGCEEEKVVQNEIEKVIVPEENLIECYEKFSSDDDGNKLLLNNDSKHYDSENEEVNNRHDSTDDEKCNKSSQESSEFPTENSNEKRKTLEENHENSPVMPFIKDSEEGKDGKEVEDPKDEPTEIHSESSHEDNIIDLTGEDISKHATGDESDSDSSVILTGEYVNENSLEVINKSRENEFSNRKSLKHSFSEIFPKIKHNSSMYNENNNSIGNFENSIQNELQISKGSFRKFVSDSFLRTSSKLDNHNNNNEFVENCSQNFSAQSNSNDDGDDDDDDDDCVIILSDDEVNYSIRKTKNRIFESNFDNEDADDDDDDGSKSKSQFSDIDKNTSTNSQEQENDHNENYNISIIQQNFSLIDLIAKDNKQNTEKNEDEEDIADTQSLLKDLLEEEKQEIQLELENMPFESQEVNKEKQEIIQTQSEEFNDSFFDLNKLKTQFGILDERTPIKLKKNQKRITTNNHSCKKSLSESFLKPLPSTSSSDYNQENEMKSFKRFSSSRKFKEVTNTEEPYDDFDEFDRMVYGSPLKCIKSPKKPHGIEKLLTGKINLKNEVDYFKKITVNSDEKDFDLNEFDDICKFSNDEDENEKRFSNYSLTEIICDGKNFLVQWENIPEKPDFTKMDSPTLVKELRKYGVKPLKRKQAINLLEHIYNQTHPFIDNSSEDETVVDEDNEKQQQQETEIQNKDELKEKGLLGNKKLKYNQFQLKDCYGDILLREDEISPEIENEEYFFPTNVKTKVSSAALPLHIAWFNLVKSSNKLRESLLHYEPIDLQEIYLFFKNLGYRYDPKDMKKFFDSRCITFKYDLTEGNNNRHTRKLFPKKKKITPQIKITDIS